MNSGWFQEKWMHDQGQRNNETNTRKRKEKKKSSLVLKATIESKCKQRLKQTKKALEMFVNATQSASDEDLADWLQANCRGLRATASVLRQWKQQGYELDGILSLIGARSIGLKARLKLNHGQWQCLLSMHDQILRGDLTYEGSDEIWPPPHVFCDTKIT